MRRVEQFFEGMLFRSRWLLAPFYIGLVIALFVLLMHFLRELAHFALRIGTLTEADVILGILALIDIVLVGNLVLIVIFSGYENFVSRFDVGHRDLPQWMAKVDFGGLKMKLLSSIVAISAIQLLKAFMNVGSYDDKKLWWMAGIHIVFLGSMLIAAISDRIAEKSLPVEDAGSGRRKRPEPEAPN
ncbi:TIGR00645 family protein [Pseudorhodoplanes sp.]|uniref:TIGR00645 family protein n=1 Tax=Pseudorhodoplanes sp. TaxID=1934341 RepID=UPI00391D6F8C